MSSRKMNICDEREQRQLADYAERSKCASKMNRKQYKRYHSPVIAAEREKVEAELSAMNPLEPEVRHFLSFEGFAELYLRMRTSIRRSWRLTSGWRISTSLSPASADTPNSVHSGGC